MSRDQFKTYLNSVFYRSIYNHEVKNDTNKMSEIDFCVQLTDKTEKDLYKYVFTIRTIFSSLIREQSIEVFSLYIRNLYNKCKSETVRHYGLTRDIIDKIMKIISDEDNLTQMEIYLKNNIYLYLKFIAERIKSNEDRSLNAEQKKKFLQTLNELDKVLDDPNRTQDSKTKMKEKTILNLPYEYKKKMIETIIKNISLEKEIEPRQDLLFLPE